MAEKVKMTQTSMGSKFTKRNKVNLANKIARKKREASGPTIADGLQAWTRYQRRKQPDSARGRPLPYEAPIKVALVNANRTINKIDKELGLLHDVNRQYERIVRPDSDRGRPLPRNLKR